MKHDHGTSQAIRQRVIIEHLRGRIVRGRLKPGERLPTHEELQRRFGTTPVTVQRALTRLCQDGYAVSVPKVGTFVSEFPPHLYRYAVVFPASASVSDPWKWSRYWSAVQEAARAMEAGSPRRFRFYHDVDGHRDREAFQQLSADVAQERLAGIIIPFNPGFLEQADFVEEPTVPVVPRPAENGRGYVGVGMDYHGLVSRAMRRFAAAGRRRVALLTMHSEKPDYLTRKDYGLDKLGLTTHPHWMRGIGPHTTWWVKPAIDDLLDRPAARRPNALFVTDDHLLEPVAQALDELGVPERDLMVIGHWNYPLPLRGRHPLHSRVATVGFDARVQLRMWLEFLEAQRLGQPLPRLEVPAQFADEIEVLTHVSGSVPISSGDPSIGPMTSDCSADADAPGRSSPAPAKADSSMQ